MTHFTFGQSLPVLALLTFGGLTAQAACPSVKGHRTLTLTEANSGKKAALTLGDTLIVRLEANATTGYAWEVAGKPPSLTLTGSRYSEDKHAPGIVGSGGVQVFQFSAKKPGGPTTLRLIYRRPFEPKTAKPAETWQATVSVTGGRR